MQIVLERSTCEQESVATVELAEALRNLTVLILELVSLVNNDIFPFEAQKLGHASSHSFKCRQTHIKLAWQEMILEKLLAMVFGCDEVEDTNLWTPLFKLFLPVRNYSFWYNYHIVAFNFLEFPKECQK